MPNQKMIKIDQSHQCCIRCARDIRLLGYQDKDVLYMQDNDMNIHCNKIYQTQNDAQSKDDSTLKNNTFSTDIQIN